MLLQILKCKLHRAELTACELNYQGSLSIDRDLLDLAGILPYEKILVVNQNNAQRLETYAIEAPRGSCEFCLNGAAARLGQPGDLVTIMAFASMTAEEAAGYSPRVVVLSDGNRTATVL
jgi:aspartate 1-decarboxylase